MAGIGVAGPWQRQPRHQGGWRAGATGGDKGGAAWATRFEGAQGGASRDNKGWERAHGGEKMKQRVARVDETVMQLERPRGVPGSMEAGDRAACGCGGRPRRAP